MRQLGIICIVVVLALGCLGAGYAQWSDNLTVTSNVQAGTFDVVFDSFSLPTDDLGMTFSAEAVSPHEYTLTLNGLNPGYNADIVYVLRNNGTIPAKVTAVKINDTIYTEGDYVSLDFNTPANGADIIVSLGGIFANTLVPLGSNPEGHIYVHTCSVAADGHDASVSAGGSFTIEIDTAQQ